MAEFEIFRGADDKHYWHLKAANGEIVAQSEGYESYDGAADGINAVKRAVLGVVRAEAGEGAQVYVAFPLPS